MTAITATATAGVHKGPWWHRRRYEVRLFINDINTGLHWHVNKRDVERLSTSIVDNAAELLCAHGLMDSVFEAVAAEENFIPAEPINLDELADELGLTAPAKGSRVELVNDLGTIKAGQIGTVTHVDADDSFPIRVAFTLGADTVDIPMNLSEVKAVSA